MADTGVKKYIVALIDMEKVESHAAYDDIDEFLSGFDSVHKLIEFHSSTNEEGIFNHIHRIRRCAVIFDKQ